MQTDEQAIREAVSTWMRASKAGDIETVVSLMTDDPTLSIFRRESGRWLLARDANMLSKAA